MIFTPKVDSKVRKNILILDNKPELELSMRPTLNQIFQDSAVSPVLVRAKDGPDAASKADNQLFDLLLIDTDVPRLMDGGFIHGISTYKNTQNAEVMVMSERSSEDLPETLRSSRFFQKPIDVSKLVQAMTEVLNGPPQKTPKYLVDVRVINAVIKSTTKVLKQFGCSSIKMGQAVPQSANAPLMGEISSVVDIKSQNFQGHLCISFDKNSFLEVVSLMLMEEQLELTQDNQDAVGEINNIIFGNAKAEITDFNIQMTVPKVLFGKKQILPSPEGSAGMFIPFATEKGHFYITIIAFPAALSNGVR
jgi:chemotaxis protein CheX